MTNNFRRLHLTWDKIQLKMKSLTNLKILNFSKKGGVASKTPSSCSNGMINADEGSPETSLSDEVEFKEQKLKMMYMAKNKKDFISVASLTDSHNSIS